MSENAPEPRQAPRHGGAARVAGLAMIPLAVFAALVAVFYFGLYRGDPQRLPSALIGKPVPEFTLGPLDGLTSDGAQVPGLASSDLGQGRMTLVNVWASWCGPCRQEHPLLVELTGNDAVDLVGINYKDVPSNALRFLGLLGNPYDRVGVDTDGRTALDWGVYGVPETFLVDPQGTIVYRHVGPLTETVVRDTLLPLIAGTDAGG